MSAAFRPLTFPAALRPLGGLTLGSAPNGRGAKQ